MNYPAHVLIALTVVFLASSILAQPITIQTTAIAILGGLLPDIDHPNSKLGKFLVITILATVFSLAFNFFTGEMATKIILAIVTAFAAVGFFLLAKPRHRGITHSIVAAGIFAAIIFFPFGWANSLFAFLAYESHLLADGMVKIV